MSLDWIPWALAIRMTSAVRWSFRLTATVNSLCEVSTPRVISTSSGTTRTSASPVTEIEPGELVAGWMGPRLLHSSAPAIAAERNPGRLFMAYVSFLSLLHVLPKGHGESVADARRLWINQETAREGGRRGSAPTRKGSLAGMAGLQTTGRTKLARVPGGLAPSQYGVGL